ncbi:hypothetical protein T4B_473 [Trichinella pseudospiralis]|uniref:Uncharacterized protein n=1 Tax=Trichinella pseudospiralis TaxID=6337 RepID=A0A0V1GMF2_TRIPS|nr:hypothetical protein T4B_473 [Trichinella pseudospiralis]
MDLLVLGKMDKKKLLSFSKISPEIRNFGRRE